MDFEKGFDEWMNDIARLWPNLGQIWVNFSQKGPFLNLPKKSKLFSDSREYASSKNQEILMHGSGKKCKKPPFLVIQAKKGHFGEFLAKMAKTVKIIKKALGTFFSRLQALTNCKVSEKINERFSRNCVTNERTDERTNGRTDERTNGRT